MIILDILSCYGNFVFRMRQMEAQKKVEKDMTDRLAQRVEEEVVQKLSRAAILSNMFKASQLSAEGSDTNPRVNAPPRHDESMSRGAGRHNPSSSSSKQKKDKDHRDRDTDKYRDRDRERDSTRGKGRGGGGGTGGLLRIQQASSSGRDARSAGQDVGGNDSFNRDLSDRPTPHQTPLQIQRNAVKTLDVECSAMIDDIRKNKALLQDFCILGPSNGAPEYWTKSMELERLLLSELQQQHNVGSQLEALEDGLAEKMWTNRQRTLQLFLSVLNSASKAGRSVSEGVVAQVECRTIHHVGYVSELLFDRSKVCSLRRFQELARHCCV